MRPANIQMCLAIVSLYMVSFKHIPVDKYSKKIYKTSSTVSNP